MKKPKQIPAWVYDLPMIVMSTLVMSGIFVMIAAPYFVKYFY